MCDEHVLERKILAVPDNEKEKRGKKETKQVENVENLKTKFNIAGLD